MLPPSRAPVSAHGALPAACQVAKEEWSQTLWVNLNVQVLQEGIDGFFKALRKLPRAVRGLSVAFHLEARMKAFRDSIPLLLDLKHEALRDRCASSGPRPRPVGPRAAPWVPVPPGQALSEHLGGPGAAAVSPIGFLRWSQSCVKCHWQLLHAKVVWKTGWGWEEPARGPAGPVRQDSGVLVCSHFKTFVEKGAQRFTYFGTRNVGTLCLAFL